MAWDFGWPVSDRAPTKVRPDEVLYFYDEPLIFVSTMGFFDAICSKIDERDGTSLMLIAPTTADIVSALKTGMISVRGAMSSKNYWVAEVGPEYDVIRAWAVTSSMVPEEFLPLKAYGLYPHFGRVPDTIEQAKAFFSIKFSGRELHEDLMSFQTFKDLVDSAFSAAKTFITPHVLSGYRSSNVFDLPITQPTFSSLAISIMRPDMDIGVINSRYAKNAGTYTKQDIVDAASDRRKEFFDKAEEIVAEAAQGEISDDLAVSSLDWLETILEVSPNPSRRIEDVEFTANTPQGRAYLHIGEEVGGRLRRAYERASVLPTVIHGVVVEVNGDSKTFVVRNFQSHRQVTCKLGEEAFARLDREGLIVRGARLTLHGEFERRTRRDKLRLTADPILIT